MINFSIDLIPFSACSSFLLLTSRNSSGSPRLLYKTCSSRIHDPDNYPFPADEFFELALIKDGVDIPYTWQASPAKLELSGEAGEKVILAFADNDTIVFTATNVGLRLMPCKVFPVQYSPVGNQIHLIDWYARGIHMFRADEKTTVEATINPIVTGIERHWGEFPCTITYKPFDASSTIHGEFWFTRYETLPDRSIPGLEEVVVAREKEISQWMDKLPRVPETYQNAAEIAWFLLWNCRVPAENELTRPAIYMSKFWMNAIWAWDNMFNALAIVEADPQLAWDQLMLFFDKQDPNGMVPDVISDLEHIYGFTKPPIHGWAITRLVEKLGIKQSLPYLNAIYKPLSKLTDWWYTYRDFDQDGLPQYFHGNDSGWDNSTVFDSGNPTEGSDLAAYMVLQCECLAFIAEVTGRKKAALRWKAGAEKQLSDLLSHSTRDDHFYSPFSGSHGIENSQSLINYLPLILGKRLPRRLRNALISDLGPDGPFLTQFGLATEPPSSIKYMADGYWRGPIWGASTYLIFDGLIQSGEKELAKLIAERYCNMCLREPGFWENYDALTGSGLRCPGYTWTASVFLLLASWLEANRSR